MRMHQKQKWRSRCFDTVFLRPYLYFSIDFMIILSLSDRYKIFTSEWIWIEVSQNMVLNKIDITMTTISKKLWNQWKLNFARSKPATEKPTPGTKSVLFSMQ